MTTVKLFKKSRYKHRSNRFVWCPLWCPRLYCYRFFPLLNM